jgi:hypothetical protein
MSKVVVLVVHEPTLYRSRHSNRRVADIGDGNAPICHDIRMPIQPSANAKQGVAATDWQQEVGKRPWLQALLDQHGALIREACSLETGMVGLALIKSGKRVRDLMTFCDHQEHCLLEYFMHAKDLSFFDVQDCVAFANPLPMQTGFVGPHRHWKNLFKLDNAALRSVIQAPLVGRHALNGKSVAQVLQIWGQPEIQEASGMIALNVAPRCVAVLAAHGRWNRLPWLPSWRAEFGCNLFEDGAGLPGRHPVCTSLLSATTDIELKSMLDPARFQGLAFWLQKNAAKLQEHSEDSGLDPEDGVGDLFLQGYRIVCLFLT